MKYVKGIRTLVRHIDLHRARVYRLGFELNPGPIGIVRLVAEIIFRFHDIEKYLFLPWLWKYWAGKGDRVAARQLYDRMNLVGKRFRSILLWPFKKYVHPLEFKELFKAERIADVVDRTADPVALEEFAVETARPLTNYLRPEDCKPAYKLLLRWLIITSDLQFEGALKPACQDHMKRQYGWYERDCA